MRILLFSRHHEPDLLKATTMKTVIVPTYVRKDGTVVPSHAKLVHYDPDKGAHQIVSGNGSHSQKLAHKKLHASVPGFAGLPDEEQAIHIMSSATNSQKKASLSGMLSKWKASLLAGKKPSESEAKAFAELQNKDPSAAYKKQKEVTDVIGIEAFAALGSTFISANKTPDQESAASLIDERWETLSAVPKEAVPGVLQGLADALGYDVSDMKAAFDAKKAAKPSAVRVTDVATDSALDRMKIPPAMQGALLKPSVTIKTKNADGVHPTISWKEYVDSYVDAGATITEWFAKPKGAHVGYLLDKDGKKVTLPDAALWYAEAAIAFKKKHAAQPTAALPLSEKPAYDYLANISKKSGGNMNTVMGEAENWLDANPGKEDELSSSLVDLGYLLVAKQMGIYKPPMLHSAFTGGAYKFISDHLDDPAVMGYRSPKEAARAWLAHNNGKDAEANQALIDHGYSSSATLGNGETTGLNAKTNAEAAVATAKLQEIASGQGGHYPHKAYKKLEHDSDWIKLGPVARLEVVLALAKQMQQTANASSAVTGWKKVALAGSNPAPAQWTAFLALDADKKSKLLDEVKAKHGNWHHLVHPAAAKAPEKPEPKIILPTGPKDGDTKAGADGTLVFKDGRWHKQSGSSAYAVTSMAQSLNNEGPIHDVSAHAVAVEKKLNLKPGSLADAQGYSPTYTVQSADGKMFSVYAHSGVVRVRTSGNNTDQESAKALVAFLDGVQKKPKLTPKEYGAAAFAAGKPHAPLADNDFWSAHSEGSLSPSFKAMEEWSKGWDDANLNAGAQKQSTAQAAAPIQAAVPPSAASVDQGTNTDFVTYHNTTDGHSKFWSVCVQGDSLITKYGKIGAKGTATVKELGSNAAAHAQMAKLIKQKSAGGYVLHSDAAPAPYKTPAPDGGLVLSPEKPTGVGFEQALDNIQKFIGDGNTSGIQQELLLLHGLTSPGAKAAKKYAQDGIDYLNSIGGEGPKEGDTKPIKPTGIGYPSTLTNIEDWINDGNVGQLKITLDALNGISSLSAKAAAKYAQDGLDYLSGAAGPKEGDTKQGADGMLVFKGGRWHKVFTGKKLTDAEIAKVASWPNNGPAKEAKTAAKAGDGAKLNDIYWSAKEGSFPKTAAKIAKLATLMGVPLVKPAGSKAAPEPSAAPSSTPPGPKVIFSNATKDKNGGPSVTSMAGWVKTGDQKGSNPGGTFKDKNGQSWYVKFPATEDHCKNELLASKLYKAAGVDVPNLRLVSKDGKVGIASKIVDGVSKVGAGIKSAPGALEGFAVDAWLGNYDSVGTGYDNLLKTKDGKAIRIDVGGSLLYRAQGAPKGDSFGTDVVELDGMRDKAKNAYGAAVFGGISKDQLIESVALVLDVPDDVIKQMVDKFGPGSASDKAALAAKLIARKSNLAKKFPEADLIANPPKPDPRKLPVEPAKLPTVPNFMNWGGGGKGLSGNDKVNQANQAAVNEIYASAMKGDFPALKKLKYHVVDKQTGETKEADSFGAHPSQHVRDFYSTIVDYMDVIANPAAKKMKAWDIEDYSDINELSDAFKAHFYGVTVGDVPANQRLGFWISLGQAETAAPFVPKNIAYTSGKDKTKGKASTQAMPGNLKKWMSAVKSSGSANQPYRDGKEIDNQGQKTRDVLKEAYAHSVEFEEGTRITKFIDFPPAMKQQMLDLPEGHVFQNPGSMCCSLKENWSWGGGAKLNIIYAKGAKALYNIGVGSFDSEGEITTIPGQRFMLLEKKTNQPQPEYTLLMLPPDDTYVENIHPKS